MLREIYLVYFLVTCTYILGCNGQDVILSSDTLDQWENMAITITCSSNLVNPTGTFKWNLDQLESHVTKDCVITWSWLANNESYTVTCTNRSVNSVTIKTISRTMHGEKWTCFAYAASLDFASNTVQILVKVRVKTVSITPHNDKLTTVENNTYSWHCETSVCRPAPRFIWYKGAQSDGENIVLSNVSANSGSADDLVSYSNNYSIRLDRAWNGLYVFCGAHNDNGNVVGSRKILLNVIYPPDGPPRIGQLESGSRINVIKNRIVNLQCSVSGGNPLPILEWSKNNDMPQTVFGNTVTKMLSWKATDTNDHELRCKSTHQLKNDTTYVLANVLFPPLTTDVSLNLYTGDTSNILQTFSVIENTSNTMALICSARGNPIPSSYRWTGPVQSNSARLELSMTRHVQGTYTCNVNNTMIAYDGYIENGYIRVSYSIEILQSPNIGELNNVTVVEGEDFMMECPIISGHDTWRSVKWINNQSIPIAQNGSLYMNNVTRSATGTYMCQMEFSVQPTYGFTKNETVTRGFYLDVACSPRQSPSFELKQNVSSIINGTAVFRFTTMAYPLPSLQWYRILNKSEISDIHGGVIEHYTISINEMQTYLILINVDYTHYGEYLLKIENQYGKFSQTYYLVAEDLPRVISTTSPSLSPSVGPTIGGAVGGLFAVIAFTALVLLYRKRLQTNNTRAHDKTCALKDSHTYQNFTEDGHSLPETNSSNVYERLQHTGSEADQKYQQLATFNDINKTGQKEKVYENLQLSHHRDCNV